MARLTEKDEYGNADIIGANTSEILGDVTASEMNLVTDALNKLYAYEDIAEEPEELQKVKRGKWEIHLLFDECVVCSECGTQFLTGSENRCSQQAFDKFCYETPFCSSCGSDNRRKI